MSRMLEVARELKKRWASMGVAYKPGVTASELDLVEQKFSVCLPREVCDYFSVVNGMDQFVDEECLQFFGLEELEDFENEYGRHPLIPQGKRWLIIIDYLCKSHMFALEVSGERTDYCPVVFINGDTQIISPSFTSYLETYLVDLEEAAYPSSVFRDPSET